MLPDVTLHRTLTFHQNGEILLDTIDHNKKYKNIAPNCNALIRYDSESAHANHHFMKVLPCHVVLTFAWELHNEITSFA